MLMYHHKVMPIYDASRNKKEMTVSERILGVQISYISRKNLQLAILSAQVCLSIGQSFRFIGQERVSEILKHYHLRPISFFPMFRHSQSGFSEQPGEILRRFCPIWKSDGECGEQLEGMQVFPHLILYSTSPFGNILQDYYWWLAGLVNRIGFNNRLLLQVTLCKLELKL